MNTDPVIQTHGLTHYFGRRAAIDSVSLSVPRGSIFALLGRNGSGKSTLIQLLLGLLTPTRGASAVFGEDSQRLTPATIARIGYTPENHPLPASLRVRDVHAYQRAFYKTWDEATFAAVTEPFSFSTTQRVSQLSRGQRAGLAIALAMAPAPELLMMDDPSLGLDPIARRTLLEAMLLATRRAGSTIFFTSHLLDDVERVADHIAVLDRSVLRVCCPIDVLRRRVRRYSVETNDDAALLAMPSLLQSRREGGRIYLTLANVDDSSIGEVRLAAPGAAVEEVPITLEESILGYLGDAKHSVSLLDRASTAAVPSRRGGRMIRAQIIKELREHTRWAMLGATGAVRTIGVPAVRQQCERSFHGRHAVPGRDDVRFCRGRHRVWRRGDHCRSAARPLGFCCAPSAGTVEAFPRQTHCGGDPLCRRDDGRRARGGGVRESPAIRTRAVRGVDDHPDALHSVGRHPVGGVRHAHPFAPRPLVWQPLVSHRDRGVGGRAAPSCSHRNFLRRCGRPWRSPRC